MSNNRELALTVALEAVINAARSLHVDVKELCETATESLLVVPSRVSPVVVEVIRQIEVAADALDYGESASG